MLLHEFVFYIVLYIDKVTSNQQIHTTLKLIYASIYKRCLFNYNYSYDAFNTKKLFQWKLKIFGFYVLNSPVPLNRKSHT